MFGSKIDRDNMDKIRMRFFIMLFCFLYGNFLSAVSLDTTKESSRIYKNELYAFANGDYAKGDICLNAGFSVPAHGKVKLGLTNPISGPINLNNSGEMILDGDLTLAKVELKKGGVIKGRSGSIFLDYDLTIPAGSSLTISSDTVIDGRNHEIIFEDGAPGGRMIIAGPTGTTLTLRNCIVRGLKNYSDGTSSIYFYGNEGQKLILNSDVVHLAGNYNFNDGFLDIKNSVKLLGYGYYFAYNSENELTIKSNSEFFIDTRTVFTYDPVLKHKKPSGVSLAKLLVMEDFTSRLFLNGCTLYLPLCEGLVLTKGHLLVDHKTIVYGNGATCGSYAYGMALGSGKQGDDLLIDIMPGADLQILDSTLHYNNING